MRDGLYALVWLSLCAISAAIKYDNTEKPLRFRPPTPISLMSISPAWKVLGPFQIGTREAVWGADPLELLGGFRALEPDNESTFPGSLTPHGVVRWSTTHAEPSYLRDGSAAVTLLVSFPDVDWSSLQLVYGWSALQYQAWVRGDINIDAAETQSFEIYTDGVLEFWLDDQLYFGGDVYSYRRAPPVVHLEPGHHQLNIRLVRDIRATGGQGESTVQIKLELRPVKSYLVVDHEHVLAPDLVDGFPASTVASVPVRNAGTEDIRVTRLVSANKNFWTVSPNQNLPLRIAPGQTRALSLRIFPAEELSSNLSIEIGYQISSQDQSLSTTAHHVLSSSSKMQPHKFTFLRPGGIVSYALIRPPQKSPKVSSEAELLPVFVYLHGAGVNGDDYQNLHTLDGVSDISAWIIFASGVTSWSGDDWHQWGWPDVETAIASIPNWITDVQWSGPGVDTGRWLVAGHSNGGQGVWYALTHKPDKIIAAAPVSGYLSIQKYVSYTSWHETDPRRMAVLYASMNSYRHEILVSNAADIPIMQQHGSLDDNVPCFHSRRMSQLINESGWTSTYNELQGKGHWTDGVMTTSELLQFYSSSLKPKNKNNITDAFNFTLVTANPAETGSKMGIQIEQLTDPGQLGKVRTCLQANKVSLATSNVQSLSIDTTSMEYEKITIDGQNASIMRSTHMKKLSFTLDSQGNWGIAPPVDSRDLGHRRGQQLGHIDAILRTRGCFTIASHHESTKATALQIARNMFQYFAADSDVVQSANGKEGLRVNGNIITVGIGTSIPSGVLKSHPIQLSASALRIRDHTGHEREFTAAEHGLAAIFLRPLPEERLELVVWGSDNASAGVAARLVPLMTGAGQPDFVVLSRECLYRGVDGALAMGFFDSSWNVTNSSFLL